MKFTEEEVNILASWSREVLENDWTGPAHKLLKKHAAREIDLIALIAAWAIVNRKSEVAIADLGPDASPSWPWTSPVELRSRVEEARQFIGDASGKRK